MNRERVREGPDHAMKRKRVSEGPDQQRTARVCEVEDGDPIKPDKDIFLSHSGSQKQLADHVADELGREGYEVFYDKDPSSLPGGHQFPPRILEAARKAKLLIVIISDEYFMSKWPMIELSAFVQAHNLHCSTSQESRSSTEGPMLLPLFFELSVDDVKNPENQSKWYSQWEILARKDERINVREWKDAFNVLPKFNGLPFDKKSKEYVDYVKKIVSSVFRCIPPRREWDLSHVQGRPGIVKEIEKKIEEVEVSEYGMKVVGLYGVGGIGKTTACMSLCNEFLREYEGRVCHLDIPINFSVASKDFFQKVSVNLTRKSIDNIQYLDEEQVIGKLCENLRKQRVFLTIDNIVDTPKSIQLAKTLLRLPYCASSLVVVTSRSQDVLERLGLGGDACLEMPDLGGVDAVKLFLHHAAGGKEFFAEEERRDIMTCVGRCYFSKGDGRSYHYHPLALQALGNQLGWHGKSPSVWVENLPLKRNSNDSFGGNPVFDILRTSFDLFLPAYQTLFMDLGCFSYTPDRRFYVDNPLFHQVSVLEWLCMAHKVDEKEILRRLKDLKRKGLLMDVDERSGEVSMHDLYREFANLEATVSLNKSLEMEKRKWVHVGRFDDLTELEGSLWPAMVRLTVSSRWTKQNEDEENEDAPSHEFKHNLVHINWDSFGKLEVLHLEQVIWGRGALNLEGLGRLRILKLMNVSSIDRIEGLERLNHLSFLDWCDENAIFPDENDPDLKKKMPPQIVGQLPGSLKNLRIFNHVVLGPDLLAQCRCLSTLVLDGVTIHGVEACSLDLSKCSSLESVDLGIIRNLRTVSGLAAHRPSKLKSLTVYNCEDLVGIPGLDRLTDLHKLCIGSSPKLKLPSLFAPTKLQVLKLHGSASLVLNAEDFLPRQLRKLDLSSSQLSKGLTLDGFNELEELDLCWNSELASLAGLGALPALRVLNLEWCTALLRLPDLSASRNLHNLNLSACSSLELHEEDIRRLSQLTLLQPVPFSDAKHQGKVRLDFVRGKMLVHSRSWTPFPLQDWVKGEWEEQELGSPPIKVWGRQ